MPTVSESSAALRFLGDEVDPEEITRQLGVSPTIGRPKGAVYRTPIGKERTSRTGIWHLEADRSRPAGIDAQIAFLFADATADLKMWRGIASRFDGEVICGLHLQTWNEGLDISPRSLQSLADRGLRLAFDIYADPES
jgi:hypothetical protein